MTTDVYNALNLLLQLLIWGAMIATFIVYFLQLRAMQRGASGQNTLSVVTFLQAQYVRDARTTVRAQLKNKPYDDWTETDKSAASLVCSTYDTAAILIFEQRLVPADPFTSHWGASIRDCYEICRRHIAEMQKPENSGSKYWKSFAVLYQAAQQQAAADGVRRT